MEGWHGGRPGPSPVSFQPLLQNQEILGRLVIGKIWQPAVLSGPGSAGRKQESQQQDDGGKNEIPVEAGDRHW